MFGKAHLFFQASALAAVTLVAGATQNAVFAQSTMAVSADIPLGCVVTAQDLAFGEHTAASDTTRSANISLSSCSGGPVDVTLNGGTSPNGTSRRLQNGDNRLPYILASGDFVLTDGTGTGTLWDIDSSREVPITSGSGSITVFGTILQGTTANPGTYVDSLGITVDFSG